MKEMSEKYRYSSFLASFCVVDVCNSRGVFSIEKRGLKNWQSRSEDIPIGGLMTPAVKILG